MELTRLLLLVLVVPSRAALAATIRVPAERATVQEAIDAAADGDTVLVAPGEHEVQDALTFRGKAISVRSDAGADATVIRLAGDRPRASVVIFVHGEESRTVLEGFTLRGGSGSDAGFPTGRVGGGLWCGAGTSPTLRRLVISGNRAENFGGGVFCGQGSAPSFEDCAITANSTDHEGGGVYSDFGSRPSFIDCRIQGNSAGDFGGGLACAGSSSPTLRNTIIADNLARAGCGGFQLPVHGGPFLDHCAGGGVHCGLGSRPVLIHCTISGNSASNGGGGVHCAKTSAPTIRSCIIWDNAGGSLAAEPGSNLEVSFSSIEAASVSPGSGNIKSDPLFCAWGAAGTAHVDPANPAEGDGTAGNPFRDVRSAIGGYSLALSPNSPCRGTGESGTDMGAGAGTCASPGKAARVIVLAPGTYQVEELNFAHRISLQGAGRELTVLRGTLFELRTGARLSDVTVTAGRWGGVFVSPGEAPEIVRATITGNQRMTGGEFAGGVHCAEFSAPRLIDCTVSQNTGNSGGGLHAEDRSAPALTRCAIVGNLAFYEGGGIYASGTAAPLLTDCSIRNNSASRGGGAYFTGTSTATLTRSSITGNSVSVLFGEGGGVYCAESASPLLEGCVISDNSASKGGGVLAKDSSSPTLKRATVSGNSGTLAGGLYLAGSAAPVISSSILWDNAGGSVLMREGSPSPVLTFSTIEDGAIWPGEGNSNLDPLLCGWESAEVHVDGASAGPGRGTAGDPFRELAPALQGYRLALAPGSPCVGTGEGGGNRGANLGLCGARGSPSRTVRLAAGSYLLPQADLAHQVSLRGGRPKGDDDRGLGDRAAHGSAPRRPRHAAWPRPRRESGGG